MSITHKNWATHLRSQKYRRNDPNSTVQPQRIGRHRTVRLHREVRFHRSGFESLNVRTVVRRKNTAFRNRLQTLETENSRNFLDVRQFLNSIQRPVIGNIRRELARHNNLKANVVLVAEFKRNENEYQQMNFITRNEVITPTTDFNEFYATAIRTITNRIDEF